MADDVTKRRGNSKKSRERRFMSSDIQSVLNALQDTQRGFYEALERQGSQFTSAIKEQASETRMMADSLNKLVAEMKSQTAVDQAQARDGRAEPATSNPKESHWAIIFGIGGIIFGLMTPLYFMIQAGKEAVDDHFKSPMHAGAAAQMASINKTLATTTAAIDRIVSKMDQDDVREMNDVGILSRFDERIQQLEIYRDRQIDSRDDTGGPGSSTKGTPNNKIQGRPE